MIGASLSKSVTKHIHTSTIFVDALRAAPRSIHGLERDTRGARKRVRAPRLIYSALPIVPGRRVRGEGARRRCDGAVPGRDRWHGSSVFSSPPPPRVLRMGQPYG